MTKPRLAGIDHAHLNVGSKDEARRWYQDVLGFAPVESLKAWDTPNGPMTLEDASGRIHLAIFEKPGPANESSIAFGTDGANFLEWKSHLQRKGLELRLADHELAYSVYFSDPWGNYHEVTTYDRDFVAERIDAWR
ncbi:VOC family protein [Elongatibacter sediminis]|uniref:VOC family protein n=1 Tax=Elongatibacter sediminis TaxID=3119006 RepID=A0AAW9RII6_9GAMM